MRGPPGGLQDGEEMVQKVGEDEGSPQSVGGTLKQRVTGEGKGGMPFHDWQRVPPAPLGMRSAREFRGGSLVGGQFTIGSAPLQRKALLVSRRSLRQMSGLRPVQGLADRLQLP